ncbi:tetratricopeptide repeat protein [Candidatus Chlamydia sanziniae]|uniref:Putative type III secretion chaperone n=1 Tax=Candidatus Chlamydia sanziniae TaxID=1806891 RepID=A0A1A9HUW6_9CHLA|nr:tetratricopeptide repeat protein [Candidatus Chlamydia sanziniae]ANH78497.1 putative type III secretion chaperone [Candidatus Chlamydia sanziniae]
MEEAAKHLAKEFLCSGINLFLSGKYEHAEKRLKETLELDPTAALAYCYLGIIALETGRLSEALNWCTKGLESEPGDSYLRYCYGVALDRGNYSKEAIEQYRAYVVLHPDDIECWFSLGGVYHRLKRFHEAIECFDKILELDPWNPQSLYNKAVVLGDMEDEAGALRLLESIVSKNPLYWKAWVKLGYLFSHNKQWDRATEAYERVVQLRPDLSDGHYNLGLCYLTLDKTRLALKAFQEALFLNEEDADAYFYVGLAHMDLKQPKQAHEAFSRSLGINLEHERAHYLLGYLYHTQGEAEKAAKELLFLTTKESMFAPLLQKTLASNPSAVQFGRRLDAIS